MVTLFWVFAGLMCGSSVAVAVLTIADMLRAYKHAAPPDQILMSSRPTPSTLGAATIDVEVRKQPARVSAPDLDLVSTRA
jgi:hypothetical protein